MDFTLEFLKKTPAGRPFTIPTKALQKAIETEWTTSSNTQDFRDKPLTSLLATLHDKIAPHSQDIIQGLMERLSTDHLLYPIPENSEAFPLGVNVRHLFEQHFHLTLPKPGILTHAPLPLKIYLEALSMPSLLVCREVASLTDSVLLGLLFVSGLIDIETLLPLSHWEFLLQQKQWGTLPEHEEHSKRDHETLELLGNFLKLCIEKDAENTDNGAAIKRETNK